MLHSGVWLLLSLEETFTCAGAYNTLSTLVSHWQGALAGLDMAMASAVAAAFLYVPADTALQSASTCKDAALPLQGNGPERDKLHFHDADLHILDIYNRDLWPGDKVAQKAIDTEVALTSGTCDEGTAAGRR